MVAGTVPEALWNVVHKETFRIARSSNVVQKARTLGLTINHYEDD